MNDMNKKKLIYTLFILCVISTSSVEVNLNKFEMSADFEGYELSILNIKNEESYDFCNIWIPSIFTPFILTNETIAHNSKIYKKIEVSLFSKEDFQVTLFNYTFLNHYNLTVGKERYSNYIDNCYFGLLNKTNAYPNIEDFNMVLNQLVKREYIEKKIFSFDNWTINNEGIKSYFYLGYSHEKFDTNKNKEGVIGKCQVIKDGLYWGCTFNEISYNNNIIDLKNEEGDLYKIYFSSENYNITFPKSFEAKFNNITNNSCYYQTDSQGEVTNLNCKNFFNEEGIAFLSLIDDNMRITIEIDNKYRFLKKDENDKIKSRIKYQDKDYFIFPLIMFKNFHIQFDAENDIISFYTKDKSILQLKKEKKEKKKSSNGIKVFLIILIIIIIISLGVGIFWFLKRRRSKSKDINKYNRFEDEEDFQNMNEKRVF